MQTLFLAIDLLDIKLHMDKSDMQILSDTRIWVLQLFLFLLPQCWHWALFLIFWDAAPNNTVCCLYFSFNSPLIHPNSNEIVPLWEMSLLRTHSRVAALKVESLRAQQGSPYKQSSLIFFFQVEIIPVRKWITIAITGCCCCCCCFSHSTNI